MTQAFVNKFRHLYEVPSNNDLTTNQKETTIESSSSKEKTQETQPPKVPPIQIIRRPNYSEYKIKRVTKTKCEKCATEVVPSKHSRFECALTIHNKKQKRKNKRPITATKISIEQLQRKKEAKWGHFDLRRGRVNGAGHKARSHTTQRHKILIIVTNVPSFKIKIISISKSK